jgi:hypothetical protein
MMGDYRIKTGMPTRHPHERPDKIAARIYNSAKGQFEERLVEVPDFPESIVLPAYSDATILNGQPPSEKFQIRLMCAFRNIETASKIIGPDEGMRLAGVGPDIFARMLAKIALGYVVGEMGIDSFRPLVRDLILGKSPYFGHWVGGPALEKTQEPPSETVLHEMHLATAETTHGTEYVLVYVRLFANRRGPRNYVVVGQLP